LSLGCQRLRQKNFTSLENYLQLIDKQHYYLLDRVWKSLIRRTEWAFLQAVLPRSGTCRFWRGALVQPAGRQATRCFCCDFPGWPTFRAEPPGIPAFRIGSFCPRTKIAAHKTSGRLDKRG
jgi:hypothetical protein